MTAPTTTPAPVASPSAVTLAAAATAVPLLLGGLLAAHPLLAFDPFAWDGRLTRWFAVHYGLLFLLPALGGVAWLVLRGFTGPLAVVGRAGVLVLSRSTPPTTRWRASAPACCWPAPWPPTRRPARRSLRC